MIVRFWGVEFGKSFFLVFLICLVFYLIIIGVSRRVGLRKEFWGILVFKGWIDEEFRKDIKR